MMTLESLSLGSWLPVPKQQRDWQRMCFDVSLNKGCTMLKTVGRNWDNCIYFLVYYVKKINKNPLGPRKCALTCSLSLSCLSTTIFFSYFPPCNLSKAFIFFMDSISRFFFSPTALFYHRKIGSHTVTAKRDPRDLLATTPIFFL